LARVRKEGIARIIAEIATDSSLFDELTNELTVPETYFFRDTTQFDVVCNQILPEITSRCGFEHGIRCWSAGCSTGEEAYSTAILLSEAGLDSGSHVVGTDISIAALACARAGRYRAWSLRGEGAALAAPYLHSEGKWKVMDEAIRHRVTFFRLNLAEDWYPLPSARISNIDLILCRNVLIYFDEQIVRAVARRLFNSLAGGGWLLTAAADPLLAEYAPFEVIVTKAGLMYRRPPCSTSSKPLATIEVQEVESDPARRETENDRAANDSLKPAHDTFIKEDSATAAVIAATRMNQAEACASRIHALANVGDPEAAILAQQAIDRYPLCPELYYLLAHLRLLDDDHNQAILLLRKAIYLAPSLIMAHFMLGSLLQRIGDRTGAERYFRNAMELAEARPFEEVVPMTDGEHASLIAAAARKSVQRIGAEKKR
jgi:chemotaxis protein methyltransferase CheR